MGLGPEAKLDFGTPLDHTDPGRAAAQTPVAVGRYPEGLGAPT
jgi:hypothetical protein